jgi:hypothetical protein
MTELGIEVKINQKEIQIALNNLCPQRTKRKFLPKFGPRRETEED